MEISLKSSSCVALDYTYYTTDCKYMDHKRPVNGRHLPSSSSPSHTPSGWDGGGSEEAVTHFTKASIATGSQGYNTKMEHPRERAKEQRGLKGTRKKTTTWQRGSPFSDGFQWERFIHKVHRTGCWARSSSSSSSRRLTQSPKVKRLTRSTTII